MNRLRILLAVAVAVPAALYARSAIAGDAEQAMAEAGANQQYTFLLFYKENNAATQKMLQTLRSGLATRDDAVIAYVNAGNPGDQALVRRYGVGRAPMPLVIAVAPNGAVTGLFATKLSEPQVAGAFVTPMMAKCMKSMQQGRLVLVCVNASPHAAVPQAVRDFQAAPEFASRTDVVSMQAADPAEAEFLQQLKIDGASLRGTTTAFLAPPAVLVGTYGPNATMAEMAAALHAAGKCCDDPNCKHNHGGRQASQGASSTRK